MILLKGSLCQEPLEAGCEKGINCPNGRWDANIEIRLGRQNECNVYRHKNAELKECSADIAQNHMLIDLVLLICPYIAPFVRKTIHEPGVCIVKISVILHKEVCGANNAT